MVSILNQTVATPLAGFRMHGGQKTNVHFVQYVEDADRALVDHGGSPSGLIERFLHSRVFPQLSWRGRRLLGWCGGMPSLHRVCQCDVRGKGWTIDEAWE